MRPQNLAKAPTGQGEERQRMGESTHMSRRMRPQNLAKALTGIVWRKRRSRQQAKAPIEESAKALTRLGESAEVWAKAPTYESTKALNGLSESA